MLDCFFFLSILRSRFAYNYYSSTPTPARTFNVLSFNALPASFFYHRYYRPVVIQFTYCSISLFFVFISQRETKRKKKEKKKGTTPSIYPCKTKIVINTHTHTHHKKKKNVLSYILTFFTIHPSSAWFSRVQILKPDQLLYIYYFVLWSSFHFSLHTKENSDSCIAVIRTAFTCVCYWQPDSTFSFCVFFFLVYFIP